MKKISTKRKIYLDEKSRSIPLLIKLDRMQKSRDKNKKPKEKLECNISVYPPIVAPHNISIDDDNDRKSLMYFLHCIERRVNDCNSIKVDLTKILKFIASGTILFLHTFHKIKKNGDLHLIEIIPPKSNSLQDQVLYQIGFYKLFEIDRNVVTNSNNVVHWMVCQGEVVNSASYAPMMEEEMSKLNITSEEISRLIKGLNEAVTNAVRHAYDTRIFTERVNYGWLVFFQFKDGIFSVAMCDVGAGIRETMNIPEGPWYKKLIRLGLQQKYELPESDSECIAIAANVASRTKSPERGKGIPEIVKTISVIKKAILVIYSNKGVFVLKSGRENYRLKEYLDSIGGTIITWSAPATPNNIQEKK